MAQPEITKLQTEISGLEQILEAMQGNGSMTDVIRSMRERIEAAKRELAALNGQNPIQEGD